MNLKTNIIRNGVNITNAISSNTSVKKRKKREPLIYEEHTGECQKCGNTFIRKRKSKYDSLCPTCVTIKTTSDYKGFSRFLIDMGKCLDGAKTNISGRAKRHSKDIGFFQVNQDESIDYENKTFGIVDFIGYIYNKNNIDTTQKVAISVEIKELILAIINQLEPDQCKNYLSYLKTLDFHDMGEDHLYHALMKIKLALNGFLTHNDKTFTKLDLFIYSMKINEAQHL